MDVDGCGGVDAGVGDDPSRRRLSIRQGPGIRGGRRAGGGLGVDWLTNGGGRGGLTEQPTTRGGRGAGGYNVPPELRPRPSQARVSDPFAETWPSGVYPMFLAVPWSTKLVSSSTPGDAALAWS